MTVSAVRLTNRALLHVGGADAESFLQGLITFDMERLKHHASGFGALLTPQGKLLFDFFLVPMDDGFLLDTLADAGADLMKRLSMYKLRADVSVSDITEDVTVLALLPSIDGDDLPAVPGTVVVDPRHVGLGHRAYVPNAAIGAALADAALVIDEMDSYLAKRIELGVPEAPLDYTYGEVFPHDINLDQINAVGFEKGCFVGQEVVSRMKHRGTARRRIVQVSSTEELPETGTEITAEKKIVGTLGSVSTHVGLAAVRLDRVNDAMEEGTVIKAGSVQVTLAIPDWVSFPVGLGVGQKAEKPARAWQRMLSGRRLDLLDPSPLDIEIEDIAHGLARVARWNGQTVGDHAYSVAQHSLLVTRIGQKLFSEAKPYWYLALLLHDAPEYVVGDMISPFKAVMGGDYKSVENRLQTAIHLRFSLPPELSKTELRAIKSCDRMAAYFEATHLAGFSSDEADRFFSRPRGVTGDDVSDLLNPLPAQKAQNVFLEAFEDLTRHLTTHLATRS